MSKKDQSTVWAILFLDILFFRRAPRVFCAVVLRGDLGCPFARQHRDIIRTDDF